MQSEPYTRKWNPLSDLTAPLRWRKPQVVRVDMDLFGDGVAGRLADKVMAVAALRPKHKFQIVTWEPERMAGHYHLLQEAADEHAPKTKTGKFTPADVIRFRWSLANLRGGDHSGWFTTGKAVPHDVPWPLPNLWLGVRAHDQQSADALIPWLLRCPAAARFVELELTGPVRLDAWLRLRWAAAEQPACNAWGMMCRDVVSHGTFSSNCMNCFQRAYCKGIDCITLRGGDKPMHPDWVRAIRDQCQGAGVPFNFSSWGEWRPRLAAIAGSPEPKAVGDGWGTLANTGRWHPETTPWNGRQDKDSQDDAEIVMVRVGKARSGRLLDGVEWSQMPEVPHVAD
jgi:protein gp37